MKQFISIITVPWIMREKRDYWMFVDFGRKKKKGSLLVTPQERFNKESSNLKKLCTT